MRVIHFLFIALVSFLLFTFDLFAQQPIQPFSEYGELLRTKLSSAPFPHPQRDSGHTYAKQFYSKAKHYNDSSVALFIPKGFRPTGAVDFVVHIHGWRTDIDTTLKRYRLPQQLAESGKNAILVVPEGPRNAPDYFGGKLEDPGGFKKFIEDVADYLCKAGKTTTRNVGKVILSGHSGAYHVISFALMQGGMSEKIREVYLFDALYGQTEKFAHWIDYFQGKMVVIYTDSGGTKAETERMMEDLRAWKIPFFACDESSLAPRDLAEHRLVFIHTDLGHDLVMYRRMEFRDYLRASCLSDR
jgi:hypothetical protein